jgi:hypothetical protein
MTIKIYKTMRSFNVGAKRQKVVPTVSAGFVLMEGVIVDGQDCATVESECDDPQSMYR